LRTKFRSGARVEPHAGVGLAEARAVGRIGGRRPKLTAAQRTEVVENVLSGRKSAPEMARLYKVSEATISRLVSAGRRSTMI
jgi:DNA invertase Pin-like site-specific DNA recombinase